MFCKPGDCGTKYARPIRRAATAHLTAPLFPKSKTESARNPFTAEETVISRFHLGRGDAVYREEDRLFWRVVRLFIMRESATVGARSLWLLSQERQPDPRC